MRSLPQVAAVSFLSLLSVAAAPCSAQEPAPQDGPWDVDAPRGPSFERLLDVEQGSWMSVDLSPDGRWLAFDLLGDLYLMPSGGSADGSQVVKLTGGIAWDMQPRFSPEGTRLAFTSDRNAVGKDGTRGKAGDNLWVMELEGLDAGAPMAGRLTQITTETFRLLNGAAWSPDGRYLVGRKHFSSRRSLGAGEMWLYHSSGVRGGATAGMQLTTRPTDQKDVNEPAFSPCGRYVYYSRDATPGPEFEYNRDSNGQIYVIERLDRETGEIEQTIGGPGGACRPTPSPDGEKLAFVRRFDGRSALHLFDLRSGRVDMVFDDLERDMQEAWAIHGVYPTIAWTPDSRSLVFWARGRIRRLDLDAERARGEVSTIPFRVRDSRTLVDPIRFAIEVAPEQVPLKMLQDVVVSPEGSQVAFQALGRIWVRSLGDAVGAPRPLTAQPEDRPLDHFEFMPSWSRDGRRVVYTTWSDDRFGSVRVVDVATRESVVVTSQPGHYVEPVFTPDGASVVYRKVGGGALRSPLWSREQGIYRSALDPDEGEAPQLLTSSGSEPQFGADAEVLYVTRSAGDANADNLRLVAIDLRRDDAEREQVLYESVWGTDYAVSPDGEWIAFQELHMVYLAPLVRTGRTVQIGPGASTIPIAKVAKDAGWYAHFSGDGRRLHWALGPTLFTRELADSFAFLAGDATAATDLATDPEAALPEPTADGIAIGFSVPHAKPAGVKALVGGTVYTMADATYGRIDDAVVVIDGNRITAVGKAGEVAVPAGAEVLDVTGQVVLPGYIEAHAHGGMATHGLTPQRNWVNHVRLAFGVTTIHDPSNDTAAIFSSSEMTRAGINVGPRTFSTGTILYGAAGSYKAPIDSYDDALFHLRRMQAVGAWSVKSYNQPRRDQRQMVVEAARELGMMVVPEGGSTFMHNLTMVVDGHTGIEHTFPVEIVYDDVLQMWRPEPGRGLASRGVGYTPTLSVAYGGLSGEYWWYQHDELWKHRRLRGFVPPEVVIPRARRRMMAPDEDYNHFLCARICKQAIDLGIPVQPGGHGQMQGINTHWEIWMMTHGGMSNLEALYCGTHNGARHLGLDADLGSIEVGKLADLVVIEKGKDPTANIRDTEAVHWTIANGRVFHAPTMAERLPGGELGAAPQFFWMAPGYSPSRVPPAVGGCEGCGHPNACGWMRH